MAKAREEGSGDQNQLTTFQKVFCHEGKERITAVVSHLKTSQVWTGALSKVPRLVRTIEHTSRYLVKHYTKVRNCSEVQTHREGLSGSGKEC